MQLRLSKAAEQSVKDMPLLQCYDDIAITVLSMVYEDAASGRRGHGFSG